MPNLNVDIADALARFRPRVPKTPTRSPTVPAAGGATSSSLPVPQPQRSGPGNARNRLIHEQDVAGGESDARFAERTETRNEALNAVRGFDPFGFAKTSARSLFADLDQALGRSENQRRVGNNARGFFGSPIGRSDLFRDFNERLARGLSRFGIEAAGLEGQNIDRQLGIARDDRAESFDTRTRELDLLSANADREQGAENFRLELQERERARKQAEKDKGGGVFGFIKDAIGLVPGIGDAAEFILDRF